MGRLGTLADGVIQFPDAAGGAYVAGKTKPKWKPNQIATAGRAAHALWVKYQAEIGDRLDAGVGDGLATNLDAFEGKRSDATRAAETLRTATREQDAAAEKAHTFAVAARGALVRSGATAAVRAAFGLKISLKVNQVSSIVAALDALVDGYARYPDAARAAGLLSTDFTRISTLRAALASADAGQETVKKTKKAPVADRKALQVRIENAIDAIINAGTLEFIDQPEKAEEFQSLIP